MKSLWGANVSVKPCQYMIKIQHMINLKAGSNGVDFFFN